MLTLTTPQGHSIKINAEKGDDIVRLLAEPNIMAISGQEGSFLSGGTVYVNTSYDQNGNAISKPVDFGVRLRFLPTVLANGRINLKVEPEVSEPSPVVREGSNITFISRKASTTVQLNDGQSFAIAGLIKSNITETVKRIPGLGVWVCQAGVCLVRAFRPSGPCSLRGVGRLSLFLRLALLHVGGVSSGRGSGLGL